MSNETAFSVYIPQIEETVDVRLPEYLIGDPGNNARFINKELLAVFEIGKLGLPEDFHNGWLMKLKLSNHHYYTLAYQAWKVGWMLGDLELIQL